MRQERPISTRLSMMRCSTTTAAFIVVTRIVTWVTYILRIISLFLVLYLGYLRPPCQPVTEPPRLLSKFHLNPSDYPKRDKICPAAVLFWHFVQK